MRYTWSDTEKDKLASFLEAHPVHIGFGGQLEMNAAGLRNFLYAQHDDLTSSSTYYSGFALQSSIDCYRMVNQSESSFQIRFICFKVGPWSKYSRCMLTMN